MTKTEIAQQQDFTLLSAKMIIPSAYLDNEAEAAFMCNVASPDKPLSFFGPVTSWEHPSEKGVYYIHCHGFEQVPHIHQRIMGIIDNMTYSDDTTEASAARMVIKKGGSWESLVNGSKISDNIKRVITLSLMECITQSREFFFVNYPAPVNNYSKYITQMIYSDLSSMDALAPIMSRLLEIRHITSRDKWDTKKSKKKIDALLDEEKTLNSSANTIFRKQHDAKNILKLLTVQKGGKRIIKPSLSAKGNEETIAIIEKNLEESNE